VIAVRGVEAYRRVEAQSRSPLELVVMMYDGAIAAVTEATAAARRGDLRGRGSAVSKALSIVGALQENLNLTDGGDVAAELDRLYRYVTSRLLDVTTKHDVGALAEVHKLLTVVRDGWSEIASQAAAAPVPARP
jgi:flagellar protein FliS